MRRSYLSPEFKYVPVFGTLNMEEESSYFGSKMLEIEDSIQISSESIIYYQNQNKEQIDLEKEIDLPPVVYNTVSDKKQNHTLEIDEFQNQSQLDNLTRWIIKIKLKIILRNYLFATLKKYRTFEGITNQMTINSNVDFAIRDYIDRNVMNRYRFAGVELFLLPLDLLTGGNLKFNNIWDSGIVKDEYKFTKFSTTTDFDSENISLFFSQTLPSSQYAFRYYFNIKYEKL